MHSRYSLPSFILLSFAIAACNKQNTTHPASAHDPSIFDTLYIGSTIVMHDPNYSQSIDDTFRVIQQKDSIAFLRVYHRNLPEFNNRFRDIHSLRFSAGIYGPFQNLSGGGSGITYRLYGDSLDIAYQYTDAGGYYTAVHFKGKR